MLKEVNKDNLKIGYLLGIPQDERDMEEFLYDLLSAYLSKGWDPTEGRTIIQLNWAGLGEPIKDKTIDESMEMLKEHGFIEIFESKGSVKYKLINHPW